MCKYKCHCSFNDTFFLIQCLFPRTWTIRHWIELKFTMPSSEQPQLHHRHVFHHDFIATPSPLFPSNLHKSILTVTPERIALSTSTIITLAWNIQDPMTTSADTIGIFLPGMFRSTLFSYKTVVFTLQFLDKLAVSDVIENVYTNSNSLKMGQYHWHCTQTSINKLLNCKSSSSWRVRSLLQFWFAHLDDSVRFQYYHAMSGEIRAQSPLISLIHENNHIPTIENITRPISIKIYGLFCTDNWSVRLHSCWIFPTDLHATNLQRGVFFKPDPYIKVTMIAGRLHKQLRSSSHFYNQEKRTNVIPNTVNRPLSSRFSSTLATVFSAIPNGTINRLYFRLILVIY